GYFNAGTVEFIYQDEEFFFLEMNTRLQVEHPVSELITGIDLVEWQIKVAAGEKLPMTQKQILASRRGHAIEVRINAENPTAGKFLPSPGTITKLTTPDGFGVRFDGGYESGDTVSQYYDNLVGKLIVWGPDRDRARRRLLRAIEETVIEGIATTLPADVAILEHPDFVEGIHSTKWVEEILDLSSIVAAPSAVSDEGEALVRRSVTAEVDGRRINVNLWLPEVVGTAAPVAAKASPRRGGGGSVAGAGSGAVVVPMQGTIVKVSVAVGDTVEVGQTVVILEAMKMENAVNADKAGVVKEVKVAAGDGVSAGDVVVVIE
ncbi:MAG: carbamoyl phosphate synthase, partial [Actinobacteria bacterium]|nr:carbamoyl phosphate synthase [Actinomycetota bacterium]